MNKYEEISKIFKTLNDSSTLKIIDYRLIEKKYD